jgi:hypothetical protein
MEPWRFVKRVAEYLEAFDVETFKKMITYKAQQIF